MKISQNTGRKIGLFYLLAIGLGVFGTSQRGLSGIDLASATVIEQILSLADQMKQAIVLDIISSAISLLIAYSFFKLIYHLNKEISWLYIGLGALSFIAIIYSNYLHWELLSLAAEKNPADNVLVRIQNLYNNYYTFHFMILLSYGICNTLLFGLLTKKKWLPKLINVWGIIASALVIYASSANLMDFDTPFILFIQNGIFMIGLTVWLLIRGFRIQQV